MKFTGERFIPKAEGVHPEYQKKMWQEHLNRYQFAGFFVGGKDVLDLGCGVGYGSNYLIRNCGPKSIISVDISEEAIGYARSHYRHGGLTFKVGDAENIPLADNSFDIVIALEVIEHVPSYKKMLSEVKRVLRPSENFIVSTPRRKNRQRSDFHTHEFTFSEFRRALSLRFNSVKLYAQNNLFISAVNEDPEFRGGFEETITLRDFSVEKSDYFIAVCGEVSRYPKAMGVFSDDSFPMDLERGVAYLEGEIKKYQEELKNIYNSRSWKVAQGLKRIKNSIPFVKFL